MQLVGKMLAGPLELWMGSYPHLHMEVSWVPTPPSRFAVAA
jgi:hypothetical protein